MYKIYINDQPLYLLKEEEKIKYEVENGELIYYEGEKSSLSSIIDQYEEGKANKDIAFYSKDYEQLKSDFKSLFHKITAAGGVVDRNGEVLFIYRRKRWDLPKGKQEKEETKEECALREVEEETGLTGLKAHGKILKTRHVYRDDVSGDRILKVTHWYKMTVDGKPELKLQHEEDIESAKWIDIPTFFEREYITFTNIKDVLAAYQDNNGMGQKNRNHENY